MKAGTFPALKIAHPQALRGLSSRKSAFPQLCDALRQMYLGQRFTASECLSPDHFQPFLHRNAFQRRTAIKHIRSNGRQLTRNFYFRQAATPSEAIIFHVPDALG